MATAKERGIPSLAAALIRPTNTTPEPTPHDDQSDDDQADDDQIDGRQDEKGRGRGASSGEPKSRRSRRATPSGETRGRKLSLPDAVFDRLQLTAIQRRKTISAVAAEILDRNLPRLKIERES